MGIRDAFRSVPQEQLDAEWQAHTSGADPSPTPATTGAGGMSPGANFVALCVTAAFVVALAVIGFSQNGRPSADVTASVSASTAPSYSAPRPVPSLSSAQTQAETVSTGRGFPSLAAAEARLCARSSPIADSDEFATCVLADGGSLIVAVVPGVEIDPGSVFVLALRNEDRDVFLCGNTIIATGSNYTMGRARQAAALSGCPTAQAVP